MNTISTGIDIGAQIGYKLKKAEQIMRNLSDMEIENPSGNNGGLFGNTSGHESGRKRSHDGNPTLNVNGSTGATFAGVQTPVTPSNALKNGNKVDPLPFFDDRLLHNAGETRLTRIRLKIGKGPEFPSPIKSMLKAFTSNGVITCQYAGRCAAEVNQRHTHCQLFRHNLSQFQDLTAVPTTYPDTVTKFLLRPTNKELFKIQGSSDPVMNGYLPGTTSWRDMTDRYSYWAPYNRADYEDMSWNLNAFKLKPTSGVSNPPTAQELCTNVPLWQDFHARSSEMFKVNQTALVPSTGSPGEDPSGQPTGQWDGTVPVAAPWQFSHVFQRGLIKYEFMNKGNGGAKVEIITYKVKRNHTVTPNIGNVIEGANPQLFISKLENAIGNGYLRKQLGRVSTDFLDGRKPNPTDISQNPNYPLFPVLKQTIEGEHDFVEVGRQSFGLSSGGRRVFEITLPGDVYNPCDIPRQPQSINPGLATFGLLDHHSYMVVIAVNGSICSNEYQGPDISTLVGDQYSSANVQFYATYTEHIGACLYDTSKKSGLHYNNGSLLEPAPVDRFRQEPVAILPTSSAVRIPPSVRSSTTTGTIDPNTGDVDEETTTEQQPANHASTDNNLL